MKKEKRMKNMGSKKGFTLMEVAMSLAIFAAVLVLSVYVLSASQQLSAQSRERLLALGAVRSTVEAIKNTPLANIQAINTAPFIPQELRNGAITLNVNSDTGNLATATLATVTISIRWTGPKNIPQRLDITTMRSRF
ncbi:MAG: hypothetical protein A3A81_00535 [Omnitrophica bacterium RIFCSPLOWO2_01_FULL_45_10b]|nr:MAG: hypothetical protein A3A81_00535 [Omnitrophica bacterium RIFCSPLOWO2_01_FULL_45_10b]